jgi:predicted DsbA family dithiol-disulfide isomerase
MSDESSPIVIDYFTDVLCIWAWIAQPRLDELHRQYGHDIELRHRYVDIFGDSYNKIPGRWGETDGFEKFSTHVRKSAAPFDQVTVHPDIWSKVRPRSSMQAHLLLKAVELVASDRLAVETMARHIRHAFFCGARDIGDLSLLLKLAADEKLDRELLSNALQDGSAIAALSNDLRSANEFGIKGSPTWVLNEGRQVLYGNVGYRILSANIEELLRHPGSEASWC